MKATNHFLLAIAVLFITCNTKKNEIIVLNNDYDKNDITISIDSFMIPDMMLFPIIAVTIKNTSNHFFLFPNDVQYKETGKENNRFLIQTAEKNYSLSINGEYIVCSPKTTEVFYFDGKPQGKESFSGFVEIRSVLNKGGEIVYKSEGRLPLAFKDDNFILDTVIIPKHLEFNFKAVKEVKYIDETVK